MKKSMTLAFALLLTGLLAAPVMAGDQGNGSPQAPAQAQKNGQGQEFGKEQSESQGRTLHKAYFLKRQEMKKHRDEMLKQRARAIQSAQ